MSLAFDSQQYAMGAIGKRPAAFAFSDLITFTRSTGGGRFNASGQYEWLPADQPRIDYDPVTGECKGLLIEEQRTNLIPYSDTSGGTWAGGGDRVLGAPTGLAGVFALGTSLAWAASAITFNYYQNLSPVAGTAYTFSVFVRYEDGRDVNVEFGNPTVENTALNPFAFVANGSAYAWSAITKEHVGGGLWRLSYTVTPSDTILRGWGILIRSTHKAGLPRLFVTGYQIEQASSPSSYIPTTTAQVTRAASDPILETLPPWFNPSAGTFVIEHDALDGAPLLSSGDALLASSAGAGRTVLAYDATGSYVSQNGGEFIAGPPLTFGDSLRLMRSATQWANAHCKSLRYYPRRLTLAEASA
ncbi:MAG: hypothetical protein KKH61_12625 [Gammaproteobacteria bacterium]|nr:hypothetical protein [Gammaproteobacteria bacterium]